MFSSSSAAATASTRARARAKAVAAVAVVAAVVVGVVVVASSSSSSSSTSIRAFVDDFFTRRGRTRGRRRSNDDGDGDGDEDEDEDGEGGFIDPELPVYVAGCESCAKLEKRLGKPLWAWFVDALGVSKTSPGRAHIANVLTRDETTKALDGMFDALYARFPASREGGLARDDVDVDVDVEDSRSRALGTDGVLAFSAGVQGTIREVMSHVGSEIPRASGDEREFLRKHFEVLFPKEAPLNRETFHALAKLILVRRILKALARDLGLVALRSGLSAPLVVDVKVVLPAGDGTAEEIFRLHTVAPKSDATQYAGARLGAITE